MQLIKILLIVVEVISAVLLIGVILLQKSKDQGMGLAFGAGMGEALFGSRAGNVLTKATVTLGAVFLASTMLLAILFTRNTATSIIDQRTAPLPAQSSAPAPEQQSQQVPMQQQPAPSAPATTLLPGQNVSETPAPEPAPAP
ncbi:MAG TPA: preprotein translocase subunit SecG [Kiritimatiellia bacterium]|jgi:preprotein translocase subunit SecG